MPVAACPIRERLRRVFSAASGNVHRGAALYEKLAVASPIPLLPPVISATFLEFRVHIASIGYNVPVV